MLKGPVLVVETPSSPYGHRYLVLPGCDIDGESAARLLSGLREDGPGRGVDWLGYALSTRQAAFGGGRNALSRAVLAGIDVGRIPEAERDSVSDKLRALLEGLEDMSGSVDWSAGASSLVVHSEALRGSFNPNWDNLPLSSPSRATLRSRVDQARRLVRPAGLAVTLVLVTLAVVLALTIPRRRTESPSGGEVANRPHQNPEVGKGEASPKTDRRPEAVHPQTDNPPTTVSTSISTGPKEPKGEVKPRTSFDAVIAELRRFSVTRDAKADSRALVAILREVEPGELGDERKRTMIFGAVAERFKDVFANCFDSDAGQGRPVDTASDATRCEAVLRENVAAALDAWQDAVHRTDDKEFQARVRDFFSSEPCRTVFWGSLWQDAVNRVYGTLLADLGCGKANSRNLIMSRKPEDWKSHVSHCSSFIEFYQLKNIGNTPVGKALLSVRDAKEGAPTSAGASFVPSDPMKKPDPNSPDGRVDTTSDQAIYGAVARLHRTLQTCQDVARRWPSDCLSIVESPDVRKEKGQSREPGFEFKVTTNVDSDLVSSVTLDFRDANPAPPDASALGLGNTYVLAYPGVLLCRGNRLSQGPEHTVPEKVFDLSISVENDKANRPPTRPVQCSFPVKLRLLVPATGGIAESKKEPKPLRQQFFYYERRRSVYLDVSFIARVTDLPEPSSSAHPRGTDPGTAGAEPPEQKADP